MRKVKSTNLNRTLSTYTGIETVPATQHKSEEQMSDNVYTRNNAIANRQRVKRFARVIMTQCTWHIHMHTERMRERERENRAAKCLKNSFQQIYCD